MPVAIQEMLLPGRTTQERLQRARDLGFAGVEFSAEQLTARVPEIAAALAQTQLQAAAVHFGQRAGFCDPDPALREDAISRLRQALADALDLGAPQVLLVPHWGALTLPDLTPFKTPRQLAADLTVWLLRTVSDLAYAIGVDLLLLPVNRYESALINRLEDAALFRHQIADHPHVKLAASTFHLAVEEADLFAALRTYAAHIAYLQVADHNGRLPGGGMLDFAALGALLREVGYTGWITLECPQRHEHDLAQDLPAALETLRRAAMVG